MSLPHCLSRSDADLSKISRSLGNESLTSLTVASMSTANNCRIGPTILIFLVVMTSAIHGASARVPVTVGSPALDVGSVARWEIPVNFFYRFVAVASSNKFHMLRFTFGSGATGLDHLLLVDGATVAVPMPVPTRLFVVVV